MAEGNPNGNSKPAPKKRSILASPVIPGVLAIIVFAIIFAAMAGIITLPHFGDSQVYEITPPATIGVYRSIDFHDQLIPLLGTGGSTDPASVTFSLGSGAGNPPPGMELRTDGILEGRPTSQGGSFKVCARDAAGRSACRTYHIEVNSFDQVTPNPLCTPCPTRIDPPCHATVETGVAMSGIPVKQCCPVIHDNSPCPVGSSPKGVDTTNPGGPYIICVCD